MWPVCFGVLLVDLLFSNSLLLLELIASIAEREKKQFIITTFSSETAELGDAFFGVLNYNRVSLIFCQTIDAHSLTTNVFYCIVEQSQFDFERSSP